MSKDVYSHVANEESTTVDRPNAIDTSSRDLNLEVPPSDNKQSEIRDQNSKPSSAKRTKVLAIASGGGHWVQLLRLRPAFVGFDVIFATTRESYRGEVAPHRFIRVPDCNRWEKFKLIKSALSIALLIFREKPDTIITTGAAPGYFAIRIGQLLRKKTVWVDSIANAEELSMSGYKAGKHVDLWLTQWKHLSNPGGPKFFGNVLGSESIECESSATDSNGDESSVEENESERLETKPIAAGPSSPSKSKSPRIFVTVGTDLPFNRLVRAVDKWAGENAIDSVFAQIGRTTWKPKHIDFQEFLEPPEFRKQFLSADLVISHAGMGTILSSLQYQKTLLVMPRQASKGEHRNEHQLATAKHLKALRRVNVAKDETELIDTLNRIDALRTREPIGPYANPSLTGALKSFIAS